jgi:hypothetical protein
VIDILNCADIDVANNNIVFLGKCTFYYVDKVEGDSFGKSTKTQRIDC